MEVRMLKTQESPQFGVLEEGEVYDLDPAVERTFIRRGIAENKSAPDYIVKPKKIKQKKKSNSKKK